MAAQMTPRFRDLPDVDWASFSDGEVPTYDSGTDKITGEAGGAGGPTGAAGGVLSGTYPDPGFDEDMATQAELDSHNDDPSFVHGITNTADLATDAEVATAVSNHSADTTSVHGITDTTVLATDAEVAGAVSDHSTDTSSVHGITDTTVLATDAEVASAVSAHESDTTVHGVDTANVPSSGQKSALAGSSGTPGVANRYVTEDDPAVGAADLSTTVIKAPTTTERNRVVAGPPGDVTPLILQGDAGQVAPLQEWRNSDDDVLADLHLNDVGASAELKLVGEAPQINVEIADTAGAFQQPGAFYAYGPDGVLTDPAVFVSAWSDINARFQALVGGAVQWGDGTAAPDTTLERTGAGVLEVNGEPVVLDDDARLVGGVDQGDIDTTVATHSADTTSVHGIADTSALATLPIAEANVTGLTAALAAKQPLDSDLTAIAALTTTSYGRSLLEAANAGAAQTTLGVSTFVKTLLDDADAATARTTLGVTSGALGDRIPVYFTGKWYGIRHGNPTPTAGSLAQSRIIYTPFQIDIATTFDRIGIHVGTTVASLVYRLGIYEYSLTTGLPTTLVLDAGTVVGSTTGEQAATISQALQPGTYYFACVPQAVAIGSATMYQVQLRSTAQSVHPIPQTTIIADKSLVYREGVTGALPTPADAVTVTDGFVPHVMLRAA